MNSNIRGVVLIAAGAASYGILATIVKYAGQFGVNTGGLTLAQYVFGFLFLGIGSLMVKNKFPEKLLKDRNRERLRLIRYGTPLGFTSCFYYLSLKFIPVSVAIVLLMQSVWMGIIVELITTKNKVSLSKWIGAAVCIVGTSFAAGIWSESVYYSGWGILFGLLAAISYTFVMHAANNEGVDFPVLFRTKYLVLGGLLVVLIFWNIQLLNLHHWWLLVKWGLILGFFGTFLPPLLFNKGFPVIGTARGSIIASLEIPVSVISASIVLNESVGWVRWGGICLILFSVIVTNLKFSDFKNRN